MIYKELINNRKTTSKISIPIRISTLFILINLWQFFLQKIKKERKKNLPKFL